MHAKNKLHQAIAAYIAKCLPHFDCGILTVVSIFACITASIIYISFRQRYLRELMYLVSCT